MITKDQILSSNSFLSFCTRVLDIALPVMTIGLSINGFSNKETEFDERKQDWLVQKFGVRKSLRGSGRKVRNWEQVPGKKVFLSSSFTYLCCLQQYRRFFVEDHRHRPKCQLWNVTNILRSHWRRRWLGSRNHQSRHALPHQQQHGWAFQRAVKLPREVSTLLDTLL